MPGRCDWAPSSCCVLSSESGADALRDWFECISAMQLVDLWLLRSSCDRVPGPPPSGAAPLPSIPQQRDIDLSTHCSRVAGVLVGSSRSCSSSCHVSSDEDDDGLVDLPADLVDRLAHCAPAATLPSSDGHAAAGQRMSHDLGIV